MEEAIVNGKSLQALAAELGLNSHVHLLKMINQDPLALASYKTARTLSCYALESEIPSISTTFADPQQARVHLECITRVLAFRNPQEYSQRIDLNVTQTVDLTRVIEAANERIVLDVAPLQLKKPSDFGDIS